VPRLTVAIRRCFGGDFDESDIGDLIQTTLLVIFRKLPEFEFQAGSPITRWAQGIARIEARNERRKRQRRRRVEGQAAELRRPTTTHLSSWMDRAAKLQLIDEGIEKLDSPLRRVVEHDLEEGDVGEFAERERIKRGSVRARRSRAHGKLRRFVRRQRRIAGERTPTPNA